MTHYSQTAYWQNVVSALSGEARRWPRGCRIRIDKYSRRVGRLVTYRNRARFGGNHYRLPPEYRLDATAAAHPAGEGE